MSEPPRWRAWIDAQLPPALARSLTQVAGIDAQHVMEVDLHNATDPVIFDRARDLCRRLGRWDEARISYRRAIDLTKQEPERALLESRLRALSN